MKDFISKNKTAIMVIAAIAVVIIIWMLFKDDIKQLFSKQDNVAKLEPNELAMPNTPQPGVVLPEQKPTPTVIGKAAFAKQPVTVREQKTMSIYRTKKAGEFIGVVSGEATIGGASYYTFYNKWVAPKAAVTIK